MSMIEPRVFVHILLKETALILFKWIKWDKGGSLDNCFNGVRIVALKHLREVI